MTKEMRFPEILSGNEGFFFWKTSMIEESRPVIRNLPDSLLLPYKVYNFVGKKK
jgi:hypothetical protein